MWKLNIDFFPDFLQIFDIKSIWNRMVIFYDLDLFYCCKDLSTEICLDKLLLLFQLFEICLLFIFDLSLQICSLTLNIFIQNNMHTFGNLILLLELSKLLTEFYLTKLLIRSFVWVRNILLRFASLFGDAALLFRRCRRCVGWLVFFHLLQWLFISRGIGL